MHGADPQKPDCFPAGAGVEEYVGESGICRGMNGYRKYAFGNDR